jgi:ABC-type multidrug transport system ATPase subunit
VRVLDRLNLPGGTIQTTLQGLPKKSRRARGDELIERVGLSDAADRKVGGYSGGMKRRLDVALALVHRPQILFLDEPTTGLDIQSRAALWDEGARLAGEDGVTVFLTTQYLEEADTLADRVGIIDHGRIVAEGTPAALKEEIGRPSVEAIPVDEADFDAVVRVLERFGERTLLANSARNPEGQVFTKLSEGLAPQEKERLKEAWPVLRTAQQLAAHERTVQSLRQAEDIRLTQRPSSVLKQ